MKVTSKFNDNGKSLQETLEEMIVIYFQNLLQNNE